jgi:thiamine biosynthesis lipoprotein
MTPPTALAPPIAREPTVEHRETFACFGSTCTVIVADTPHRSDAADAVALAQRKLLGWHRQFSRFDPDSELSALAEDPGETVAVSPMMRRVVASSVAAAAASGGLVDPTLVDEIEEAGYRRHFEGTGIDVETLLELAPPRRAAGPSRRAAWRRVGVHSGQSTVTRPQGVRLDPGGIAKGVFADELAAMLAGYEAFVVDCGGDMRLGGRGRLVRPVHVASPFDGSTLYTFELAAGAVATSGISARSWLDPNGQPAHHILDPATGEPAFTGVVQVTALAPTAAEAEMRGKAAILSGPLRAHRWLEHGGLVVLDSGDTITLDLHR